MKILLRHLRNLSLLPYRKAFLLLTFVPFLTYGQTKDHLVGTWKLDKAYSLRSNDFEVFNVEKHPFDTIHLDKDNSFYVRCSQIEVNAGPPKEERWTTVGQWDFKKKALLLTGRRGADNKEKLVDLKYRIILKDNSLYINYGKINRSERIYVRYFRL